MEFKCKNKKCGRLIADVTDESMLPNVLECQHCHHVNIIRRKSPRPIESAPSPEITPKEPAPGPEEPTPELEDLSTADSPTFQAPMTGEPPGPATEGTAKEVE